jgi:hypothetical protein
MADRAIDVYLNDHLAGATLGSDLAEQIRERHEGSRLGELMNATGLTLTGDVLSWKHNGTPQTLTLTP